MVLISALRMESSSQALICWSQASKRVEAYKIYDVNLKWFLLMPEKESVSQAAASRFFSAPNPNASDAICKMETETDTPTFQ